MLLTPFKGIAQILTLSIVISHFGSFPFPSRSTKSPFPAVSFETQALEMRPTHFDGPHGLRVRAFAREGLLSRLSRGTTQAPAFGSLLTLTSTAFLPLTPEQSFLFGMMSLTSFVVALGSSIAVDHSKRVSPDTFIDERERAMEFIGSLPRAAGAFGSARITYGDPTYELAFAYGRAIFKLGGVVRTGAGPGIMEIVMKGYIQAREEAGDRPMFGNMTQGIKISLPFEALFNPYVEHRFESNIFIMRKLGLYLNSFGACAFPGGIGTLDEVFEVMQRNRMPVLLEPDSGPLKHFWTKAFEGFEAAWASEGLEIPVRPIITTDPEYAAYLTLQKKPFPWRRSGIPLATANRELRRGYLKLEASDPAAAVWVGSPDKTSESLEYARDLMHSMVEQGRIVRVGSRGSLLNVFSRTTADFADLKKNLQAVLFVPPGENLRASEFRNFQSMVTTRDPSVHQVFAAKRGQSYYFLPGRLQTMNRLFDLWQLMQVFKMERRPMYLVKEHFWKLFLGPILELMLTPIPIVDESTGLPLRDALTQEPLTYTLISPGDEKLLRYANETDGTLPTPRPFLGRAA